MRSRKSITLSPDTVHPDPISAPGSVDRSTHLIGISPYLGTVDQAIFKDIVLTLAAPTTESVTLSVYAVDERTLDDNFEVSANTIFHPIETGVEVAGSSTPVRIKELSGLNGLFYIRQTADTLTEDRQLRVIAAAGTAGDPGGA